jgi:diguanylate cyclase
MRSTREMQNANSELENRLKTSVQQMATLQSNLEAIRVESLTDPLTLLANRKSLETAMDKLFHENRVFSLLVTDIDHFKTFNDRYGHLTGDRVLRLVAGTLKQSVKGRDTAARYGGEEFVILLPETGLRPAMTVAETIRRSVMNKELVKRSTGENLGYVTLSIGVATRRDSDTSESLIGRADACLYAAKRAGRNRVVCETDPEMAKVA